MTTVTPGTNTNSPETTHDPASTSTSASMASRWVRAHLGPLKPRGWEILSLEHRPHRSGVEVEVVIGTPHGQLFTGTRAGEDPVDLMFSTTLGALMQVEPIGPGLWAARSAGHIGAFIAEGEFGTQAEGDTEKLNRLQVLLDAIRPGALTLRTETDRGYVALRAGSRTVVAEVTPTPAAWKSIMSWAGLVAAHAGEAITEG
jgi:hypothetical protein